MRSMLFILLISLMPLASSAPSKRIDIQKVTDNVYALVGQRGPMSKWNFGTNATFGVVVTDQGVVLIDSGASDKAARYIHQSIQEITDKPVVLVINTGSEDLRWLGNTYFKSLGAKIITSQRALEHQHARSSELLSRLDTFIFPEFSAGTTDTYADETFTQQKKLVVGSTTLILNYAGPAYMPGDFYVWLPDQKVVFSGNIISTERMLAVARESNTSSWMNVFREIEDLNPRYIIPGHGHATDIKTARADTYTFLQLLRKSVKTFIEQGGQIENVSSLKEYPLSPYERLIGYDMLLGRNALHVYMELEWE
ncbi:hypothetical protein MNBD_GAMMA21-1817 [hydrothermal vent metagenome]|uniref:Metallo-beta-lactamase domain-containing protein n=1 Tax=hydrothermal vent metagenome TaxID=652676 RepID=A0A3B0ZXT1_9ZZZZ